METFNGVAVMFCVDVAEWETWLAENYELDGGVWLKVAKKGSGITSITITEALDVSLCYGWIDSQRRGHDEQYFLQKYSRRRAKSAWSQVNVAKAEALIAAGRMQPAGFAEIEAAQADGRWEAAYVSQRNATVPPDLAEALAGNGAAKATFDSLGKSDRYAVIFPLLTARTPAGRAARLEKAIAQLAGASKGMAGRVADG